jgi:hypothetical protein
VRGGCAQDAGAQLVALNYQTCDEGYQLSRGRFRAAAGGGYVLKPDYMRALGPAADPRAVAALTRRAATGGGGGVVEAGALGTPGSVLVYVVRVCTGRNLPKPLEDRPAAEAWVTAASPLRRAAAPSSAPVCSPAVRLELFGGRLAAVVGDVGAAAGAGAAAAELALLAVEHGASFETAAAPLNGLAPVWGEACALVASDPSTAVLRIAVVDRTSTGRRGAGGGVRNALRAVGGLRGGGGSGGPGLGGGGGCGNTGGTGGGGGGGGGDDGGSGGALMGWETLPLAGLRAGWVRVGLRDRLGVTVRAASVLLHVTVTEHVIWTPEPAPRPPPSAGALGAWERRLARLRATEPEPPSSSRRLNLGGLSARAASARQLGRLSQHLSRSASRDNLPAAAGMPLRSQAEEAAQASATAARDGAPSGGGPKRLAGLPRARELSVLAAAAPTTPPPPAAPARLAVSLDAAIGTTLELWTAATASVAQLASSVAAGATMTPRAAGAAGRQSLDVCLGPDFDPAEALASARRGRASGQRAATSRGGDGGGAAEPLTSSRTVRARPIDYYEADEHYA